MKKKAAHTPRTAAKTPRAGTPDAQTGKLQMEDIARLAHSLKYSVNVGASNLRLQRNRTVAVVLPLDSATRQHVSDPFFVSLLGSLADALTPRGYDMLLSRIDADRLDLAGDLAASGRAIGVILIGQWHHHDQINELAARNAPMVVWGAQLPQQLYCTIGGDNIAGGMLATEHIINNGRRRLAFFGDIELPEIGQRFEGFQRAIARHGLAVAPELVLNTPFIDGSALRAVEHLLSKKIKVDSIFASSDLLALEAIGALRARGLRVPQDVSVVGYDDIGIARYYHPSLSTIRQPILKGGEAMVDALMKIVEGKRPKSQILPTELIIRESSGNG